MPRSVRFLKRFIQSPQVIGSIVPSSPALVSAMLAGLPWDDIKTIAELGAGTGVITARINMLRSPGSGFLCFENDLQLHRDLTGVFPGVMLERDAFGLGRAVKEHQFHGLDCVVSALPLINFPTAARHWLLLEIHRLLNPGGIFVSFHYTRRLEAVMTSTFTQLKREYVWANVPPAFVFVCRK